MILDRLSNANLYASLHPLFAEGFRFIREQAGSAAVGRHELTGGAYALVQEYDTKPLAGASFEAHRKFIDIQYIASGSELIYYANLESLTPGVYQEEKDFQPLTGAGSTLTVGSGEFAIFYPQDGHLPSRETAAGLRPVRKVVVKIPVL
jgi:biofilm protein TabA